MVPAHVGIIPDGNRRYGIKNKLSLEQAYLRGMEKVENVVDWSRELGIKFLTIWGFSTENFKRSPLEKKLFFGIVSQKISRLIDSSESEKDGIRIKIIGRKDFFPENLSRLLDKAEEKTAKFRGMQLNFAVGYGGRQEIIDACNMIINNPHRGKIDTESFSSFLYTAGMPDPDLIIRTSGESRLSGFMPWQSVYSEIVFLKPLWPELMKSEFVSTIKNFENRHRRFGK